MRTKILVLLACLLVAGAGCTSDSFVGTCKYSAGALTIKQAAVPFIGCDKAIANIAIVRALETCVDGWHQDIIDGNEPAGDFVACSLVNAALLKSEGAKFASVVKARLGLTMMLRDKEQKRLFAATPEQIESAFAVFKNACRGYYDTVDRWCLAGEVK